MRQKNRSDRAEEYFFEEKYLTIKLISTNNGRFIFTIATHSNLLGQ